MRYLPIAIKLKTRRVIVVGAGGVAQRKIETLVLAGAKIDVIAPRATDKIRRLSEKRQLSWTKRRLRRSDIGKAILVIAATNDNALNKRISRWAHQKRIAVNVVDRPSISDFISPAILRPKGAIIAVYTDGENPVLSRDLKNYLKERWDDFLSYRDRL